MNNEQWIVTFNDGDKVVLQNRINGQLERECEFARETETQEAWSALWPVGSTHEDVFEVLRIARVRLSTPLPGSVVVFDWKSIEPTEVLDVQVAPSLHIVSPILHHVKFTRPIEIEGFFERDNHGAVEFFAGQFRWDANGAVMEVIFRNPAMQAEAEQWRPEDRPRVIYWHDNSDDGGLQLKAMSAAAGG